VALPNREYVVCFSTLFNFRVQLLKQLYICKTQGVGRTNKAIKTVLKITGDMATNICARRLMHNYNAIERAAALHCRGVGKEKPAKMTAEAFVGIKHRLGARSSE
jgi:hypothetical protein